MGVSMWTEVLCFSLLFISCVSYELHEDDASDNGGWIPSTKEKILHLFKIPEEPYNSHPAHNSAAVQLMNRNVIKLVRPRVEEPMNRWNEEMDDNSRDSVYPEGQITDQFYPNDKTETFSAMNRPPKARKAKQFTDHNTNEDIIVNNNYIIEKENIQDSEDNPINKEKRRTYEVNEDIISSENIRDETTIGYSYNPPEYKKPLVDKGNLTSVLLGILSKHSIHADDNLPNYNLSLRNKNQNPAKEQIAYYPLKFKVPYSYNNLNHLPVNPMLAVFLSNYGYYHPGLYGIQRSYNNLYGYLASNNMHNNMPFGEYKIFSDTDSSN